jgi:anion-transporting  ArsA/GET3 family ATPase
MSLLDKRILIVTGKGGTGKTTIATALGLWAARTGRSTLLVECNGARHIPPLFRQPSAGYTPCALHPGLSAMSITAEEAIEDYVVKQIKVKKLYSLVFRNRVMGPFMDAVPGLHDAVHLGKITDLAEEDKTDGRPTWDLIIVDAPATGHGLHMLASARSMMELTRAGPVFEGVKTVHKVISDRQKTGLVLTCLPEALPVNETIALSKSLGLAGHRVAAVVLNEMVKMALPEVDDWARTRRHIAAHTDPAVAALAPMTDRWIGRLERAASAQDQLIRHIEVPIVSAPFFFDRNLSFPQLQQLSETLAVGLGAP